LIEVFFHSYFIMTECLVLRGQSGQDPRDQRKNPLPEIKGVMGKAKTDTFGFFSSEVKIVPAIISGKMPF